MNLIARIEQAIFELESDHRPMLDRKNLMITFSPLVARLLDEESYKLYPMQRHMNSNYDSILGVSAHPFHYENEIVVYHKEAACYRPDLKRVIDCRHLINIVVVKS